MEKDFAMKCNEEQFKNIKPKLKGIEIFMMGKFKTDYYLVYFREDKSITNGSICNREELEIHETWNEKKFLEACGIEVEKPIRTNKLTELEKRVERLENYVDQKKISDMPENPLIRDKKSSYQTFQKAIEANKILLPKLSDTIKLPIELKNYKPFSFGLDFGFGNDKHFGPISPMFGESFNFEGILKDGKNTVVSKELYDNLKEHLHKYRKENNDLKCKVEELEAENKAILAGNSVKLEVGKWYKGDKGFKSLIFITEIEKTEGFNKIHYYGFIYGEYRSKYYIANTAHEKSLVPATESEVFEALKNEAVKRGYKNGNHNCLDSAVTEKNVVDTYELEEGKLWYGDITSANCVFKDGVWADVLEIISKSEAEKQLGKKIID